MRNSPISDVELQPIFQAAGWSWPPDISTAFTSCSFWGLPDNSFVQLVGLPIRAVYIVVHRLLIQGKIRELAIGDILLTHAERGIGWSQPGINEATTCVPDMKLVVLKRDRVGWRLSWAAPAEVFALQGMPLAVSPAQFSMAELVGIAGDAFHLQTAVAHVFATLAVRGRPSGR